MRYLFWSALIVLLDLSKSQVVTDVEVPCQKDADCQSMSNAPSGVKCFDSFCKCLDDRGKPLNCVPLTMSNNSGSLTNSSRATSGLVGRFCTSEKECGGAETNAFCNKTRKQCQCSNGFLASEDYVKCLPALEWGKSGCEIAKQCNSVTNNSTCSNGSCVCETGFHYDSSACWTNKEFGANCSVAQECSVVEGAICDGQSRCSCPVNMVIHPNSTSCLSIASKIEDSCIESIQCTQLLGEGGVCMDQLCRCQEHHHYSELSLKCLKNLEFGAQCERDDECSNGEKDGHGPMRCLDKKCVCAENFQNIGGVLCESVLQQDPNSAGNRLSAAFASVFALILGYFVLPSLIL